jgi:hypothetical protein
MGNRAAPGTLSVALCLGAILLVVVVLDSLQLPNRLPALPPGNDYRHGERERRRGATCLNPSCDCLITPWHTCLISTTD